MHDRDWYREHHKKLQEEEDRRARQLHRKLPFKKAGSNPLLMVFWMIFAIYVLYSIYKRFV